jgi:fibro-slime domain-containing protein
MLRVPAIFRDFNLDFPDMFSEGFGSCANTTGMVNDTLTGGKPVAPMAITNCLSSPANFAKWYTESSPDNRTTVGEILLFDNGAGGFVNRYGTAGDGLTPTQYSGLDGNPMFFPLDSSAFALTDERHPAAIPEQIYGGNWNSTSGSHNFHFTTEVQYWFEYTDTMDATLNFTGDDDVWVFVNNHLAVDLGGTHVPEEGSVRIAGGQIYMEDFRGDSQVAASAFQMQDGNVYVIKVFHAERKQVGSSFRLTLAGFDSSRSDCQSQCGDAIIGAGEECDDGVNDGGYNECQPGCVLGGYCGDGIRQEGEACDDGDPNKPAGCSGCRILVVK